ncbi:MAG TPA: ABC transporter permease [Candidatus Acidoferrum sp.]|jgi:ABC-2 type transport system permease protein|nr:ABC transporter permease [Candidatus Acidoferrum sp.]
MLVGLLKLTWIEIKIFMREPLGAIGTLVVPVVVFLVLGRIFSRGRTTAAPSPNSFAHVGLPVLASLLIAVSAVLSLVTIISIYREGGILKRLRATPLRPYTILTAHVLVKLLLTAATLLLMVLVGKRYYPADVHAPLFSFTIALLISTCSILSIGFLIASIVPTARFAQPIGAIIFYPMFGFSGLFTPVASFPPLLRAVSRVLPLTYAVSLLEGIWNGEAWSAHLGDIAALALGLVLCIAISTKVFRWE